MSIPLDFIYFMALVVFLLFLGLGAGLYGIFRMLRQKQAAEQASQHQGEDQWAWLKSHLDTQQEHMMRSQKLFEESFDKKNSQLRLELSESLRMSREDLGKNMSTSSQALQDKVSQLDEKVEKRLGQIQDKVQDKLEMNLKEGFKHFAKIQEHLHEAGNKLQNLSAIGESIHDLNNLLKLPHLRGSFGEATLERILNDLLPTHAYELQYQISPHSTERVDAIIRYPKAVLPIDSKFPREAVLELFDNQDPSKLESARKDLAEVMKNLAKQIKTKYIQPENGTTDMALLFVPSETLYFEIIRNPKLTEQLSKLNVFPVSPNTLAVTLHSISIARDYYEMAQGVEKTLQDVKKSQKHFYSFQERFEDINKSLKKTQGAFEKASTHLGRYESAVSRLVGKPSDDIIDPQGRLDGTESRLIARPKDA